MNIAGREGVARFQRSEAAKIEERRPHVDEDRWNGKQAGTDWKNEVNG